MRLAAVDVGSNTVHALVADVVRGQLEEVAHYVEMPELGTQVARTGAIGAQSKVAIRALLSVVAKARSHNFDVLIAAATQAVRQATDGSEFAMAAGEEIGATVHVISSRREAQLSFLGVASRHAVRQEWAMTDLGGGSTEVVIARGKVMLRDAMIPIGSGVLAGTYLSDPPKPQELARLRKHVLRDLIHVPEADAFRLVATGGTASNLPVVLSRHSPPATLTIADLRTCEARLDAGRAAEVARAVELPVNRVKAMRAGVQVLLLLLDWYGLAVLQISHEGLRQGMLLAYLARNKDWWV